MDLPYEKPQRKKRMVTRMMGKTDCRSVNSAALLLELFFALKGRALMNSLMPMAVSLWDQW